MAGAASFSGDFDKLRKLIEGVQALASKQGFMRRCYRALGEEALNQVHESFARGVDPYGNPWARPKRRVGQPLRDTGRLMNSFRMRLANDGFIIGSNVVYARIHNFGGAIPIRPRVNAHAASGQFRRRSPGQTRGSSAVRVSFTRAGAFTMPRRQFLPDAPNLGPRWTPAMSSILRAQVRLEMGR